MGLKWTTGPALVLGVLIESTLAKVCDLNYDNVLEKIIKVIQIWENRKMTPLGKITVIKSEIVSQLQYLSAVLPDPSVKYMQTIEGLLYKFIWNNGPDKIKRSIIIAPIDRGGMNMVHLPSKIQTTKISWIFRLLEGNLEIGWRQLVHNNFRKLTNFIFTCNTKETDLQQTPFYKDIAHFWQHVYKAWCKYHFHNPTVSNEILNQSVWFNSHIKIENKIVFNNKWYEVGIKYIIDLTKEVNNKFVFLSAKELSRKYNIKVDIMKYNSITHAIPKQWKREIKGVGCAFATCFEVEKLKPLKQVSKKVYNTLVHRLCEEPDRAINKWMTEVLNTEKVDILNAFMNVNKITISVKLRNFQYQILQRTLVLNPFLLKINIKQSDNCTFCESYKETIVHFFYECENVQQLWTNLFNILKDHIPVIFSKEIILYNCSTECLLDKIILITKHYVYASRCNNNKLSLTGAVNNIKKYYIIEKKIALLKGKVDKHYQIWSALADLF